MNEARSAAPEAVALARSFGPWSPFESRVFTVMWLALLLSNVGTWMRDVGAGWLMTSLSASATAVALVQAATTLPIFLLALPAGALADIVDRRRLMLALTVLMGGVSAALALVAQAGVMTPTLLLVGLLAAGAGSAVMTPVLQSLTPRMVERGRLREAIALNSMGFNLSRAIGPALGGLVVVSAGVAWTFVADALSFVALFAAFWWWKGASAPATTGVPEHWGAAMRTGLRFALHAPGLQRVLLRAGSFFLFSSAYWALLPLVARRQLQGDATVYGLLVASVGAGAVVGGVCLPLLRRRVSSEWVMRGGTVVTCGVLVALAVSGHAALAALALGLAGACWIAVLTTANVTAQAQLPDWVRGRGLAIYLTVFYGAMTLGSVGWGRLADTAGIPLALLAAAGAGALALGLAWWKPLPQLELDLTPAQHWPEPVLKVADGETLAADRGPVMVTVVYDVDLGEREAFVDALRRFSGERLRNGAHEWSVFEDAARPGHFIETFLVASWDEHKRQHQRVSVSEAELQRSVHAFHRGPAPPVVAHWLAPAPARDPGQDRAAPPRGDSC